MTEEEFQKIAAQIHLLKQRPSNETLLQLYGLFKQATEGDVTGPRPGILDIKGRAKYDAWSSRKGISKERAREEYAKLAESLLNKE